MKDKDCITCKGKGTVPCPAGYSEKPHPCACALCGGTGVTMCATCGGTGKKDNTAGQCGRGAAGQPC